MLTLFFEFNNMPIIFNIILASEDEICFYDAVENEDELDSSSDENETRGADPLVNSLKSQLTSVFRKRAHVRNKQVQSLLYLLAPGQIDYNTIILARFVEEIPQKQFGHDSFINDRGNLEQMNGQIKHFLVNL